MIRDLENSEIVRSEPRPISAYALTLRCNERRPLLVHDRWNRVLAECITCALRRHRLDLRAYIFLPDAVHLLVTFGGRSANLPRMLYVTKRAFAEWVKPELREINRALWRELVVRERPGRYVFRFWEPGCGLIESLESSEAILDGIRHIHDAPVAAGLCRGPEEWRWSSWRRYHETDEAASVESLTVFPLPTAQLAAGTF